MSLVLTGPEGARALARSRWDQALRAWLLGEEPRLQVPIRGGAAPEREILPNLAAYRDWIRSWKPVPHVGWRTVRKGALGEVSVPAFVLPPTIDAYADWAGTAEDLALIRDRLDVLSRFGCERSGLARVRWDLVDIGDEEFQHLLDFLTWRRDCPEPTRARDVPLIGVGSKWVENRIGLIEPLLTSCGLARDGADRFARCGLIRGGGVRLPLRFDPEDFPVLDFDCDPGSFLRWPERTHTLLIIENEAPFRTLPPRPGYALAWGSGHAARAALPELPVADQLRLLYWGDCDSHGYAILNGLRRDLPHLRPVGMGTETVQSHEGALIPEADSERIETSMPFLGPDEAMARMLLLERRARLEQERVRVPEAALFPS